MVGNKFRRKPKQNNRNSVILFTRQIQNWDNVRAISAALAVCQFCNSVYSFGRVFSAQTLAPVANQNKPFAVKNYVNCLLSTLK